MSSRHKEFAEQLLSVRPVTRSLVTSILMDAWPNHAAIVDFGIDSQKHYESLYYPIREAEIMPKALDAALGDGPKLTAMTREAASNPHKDVQFHTSWDVVLGRESPEAAAPKQMQERVSDSLARILEAPEMKVEDSFDRVVTNLRHHFHEDGFGERWEEQSPETKVRYLATFAHAYEVSQDRFFKAAQHILGTKLTGYDEWFVRNLHGKELSMRSWERAIFDDQRWKPGLTQERGGREI